VDRGCQVETPDKRIDFLYRRTLLNIKANRFDTGVVIVGSLGWYKQVWIRDGVYTMMGLDLAGYHEEAENFTATGSPTGAILMAAKMNVSNLRSRSSVSRTIMS
jgi:hypothetical protein